MKLHKLSHLLLFFILLFPASPIIITGCSSSLFARKPGTLSESELKNILKEITVKVLVDDKEAASGTIIKKQNGFYTVLTNYHVIENAKSVKIVTPDNQVYPVEFSKVDRQDNKKDDLYDLAKLTFSSETTYLVAGLGEENIKPGEKVFAGGYVKGNLQTTKGTAKLFLNQPLIKGQQIAYDNDIRQGMSGGAIINENGYLVGINSKLAHPVLQTDFRYLQGEQPDEKTLKEWGNYSWGIAVNLVDEAAPDLALFPERVIRKIGGIPAKVLDIAKLSSVQIKKADGGIGSGVIIAKDKDIYYVLTAAHVVEDKQEYQVVAPDKQVYKVDNQTIRTRKGLDMAVLQFRSSQVYQVATLGDYELKEQFVFLYGWKGEELNHPSLFSVGIMGNSEAREVYAKTKGYELAYFNEGFPGMSGGGIWDTEGQLVGIHNYAETDFVGLSLGLSIESFLFYQSERLWQLPPVKLNVAKNQAKSADINSMILSLLPTYNAPDPVNGTGKQWLTYGIQLWRLGNTDNAIEAMKEAAIKDPHSWQAYYNIGLIWLWDKKYNSALFAFNTAINKQPTFHYSYAFKGLTFVRLNKYENALQALNKAITEAKKNKKEDFYLYQIRGNIFDKLNRYDESIADFTQAIKFNPRLPSAYYNRGNVYSHQGNLDMAIASYTEAITIDPQYDYAYKGRADIYLQQRKNDLAISDFTQAIKINPQYAEAYSHRALAYIVQGKNDLAISDFTQAIKINPQDAENYTNRGSIYKEQGKNDLAIADLDIAIKINPQDTLAYRHRTVIYSKQGKNDLVIADLTKIIKLEPQNANVYMLRGITYREQKQSDFAIADFNKAIKINPLYVDAYNERGAIYFEQRKIDLAIADFDKTIKINPLYANAYNNRAGVYFLKGNKQQGIKDLETAKQLYQQQGEMQKANDIQDVLNKL